jgi:transcription initiation factor TFIID TATA-box-binding protein
MIISAIGFINTISYFSIAHIINRSTTIHETGDTIAGIKVENIVATAVIADEIVLEKVRMYLKGGEFSPKRFPGLIYHTHRPKSAVLLFRSGKLVCTGTRTLDEVKKVINGIVRTLKKHKLDVVAKPEIHIQNIVASADLGNKVELVKIAITFGIEKIEYEPEQFPGLVYRIKEPKVVILIFSSGKIVCTGGTNIGDVKLAVVKLKNELSAAGFLK